MKTRKEILEKLREVESQDESLMDEEVKTSRRAVITTLRWVLDIFDDEYMRKFEEEHKRHRLKLH